MSQIDILTRFFKLKVPKFDIATWHDYIKQDFIAIDALLANFVDAQNFKGAWQTSTEYEKDDLVFIENTDSDHYGELFRVLVTHTTTADDFDTFYDNNPTYYDVQGAIGSEEALKNAKAWASKIDGMVTEKSIPIDYSSKAYAIGGVGTETNNAKYYKEQAEAVLSDTNFINVSTDLANPSSKIKTCADNIDNINAVNNNKTNIDTVATDLTGTDTIGTVASNIANVNAVGLNISAVTNVNSNMSDINDCVTNMSAIQDAPNQAQSAEDYATESRVWAIGDDDDVDDYEPGEHSSHTYANLAMAIANTDEDVPIAEGINAENVIRGPKGDPGADGKDGKDGQDGQDGADATINGENTVTITATDGVSLSQSGTNLTISGSTLQNNITNIQNVIPDGTTVSNKLTNNDIVDEKIKNTVYRSLSNTQAVTLLDTGTYNGKEVTSGEIFTTEDGAFKKYIKETIGFGIDATTLSDLICPCNETVMENGEEVLYAPTGNNALFLRSTNKGKTWTPVSSGRTSGNYQNRLYHFNGVFYAVYGGYDGGGSYNYWVDYSSDLQNWSTSLIYHGSSSTTINAPHSNAIATSTHIFIGISTGQYGDACFRAELPLSPTSTWTSNGAATGIISEFNGKLVTGKGYSLDNGDTWNDNNVYYGTGVYFIKNNKMYAVGRPSFSSNGYLWESTDGVTFTDLGQFTDNGVSGFFLDKAVSVEGDDYAYGALGGTLYYADLSDNVKTWTAITGFDVYQALIETEPSVLFSISDTYNTQQGVVGIQYNKYLKYLNGSISGASSPTDDVTIGYLGQIYIDTTNKDAYICVESDPTIPTYTWKQITLT